MPPPRIWHRECVAIASMRKTHETLTRLEIAMKHSLVLAGLFGMLLTPVVVLAHGHGGNVSGNSYHPVNNAQPLTFQNHQQPKFVNPTPSMTNPKSLNPVGNKLNNQTLHLGAGGPVGGPKV